MNKEEFERMIAKVAERLDLYLEQQVEYRYRAGAITVLEAATISCVER